MVQSFVFQIDILAIVVLQMLKIVSGGGEWGALKGSKDIFLFKLPGSRDCVELTIFCTAEPNDK